MSQREQEPATAVDYDEALAKVMPRLRHTQRLGKAAIVLLGVLAVGAAFALIRFGGALALLPILLFVMSAVVVANLVKSEHVKLVMPSIAAMIRMEFDRGAVGFTDKLPSRLLPGPIRNASDLMHGTVAGRTIRFAEVKVETGGKSSSTLFHGLVIHIPNLVLMPPLFIARDETLKRSFFKGPSLDASGLVKVGDMRGTSGSDYSLWSSSMKVTEDPGMKAVLDLLKRLDVLAGAEAKVFSITSNGEETHIAIACEEDIYPIGGLGLSNTGIADQMKTTVDQIALSLGAVSAVLTAETEVLKLRGQP